MKRKLVPRYAFCSPRALLTLLLCAAACLIVTGTLLAFFRSEGPTNVSQRTLTFAERVAYQRAIEDVYWRHRIWPKERPDPKPPLEALMSQAELEKKVHNYLRKSRVLKDHWQRPITAEQLQAEMERMAHHTKQPEVLRELFSALENNPFVIAECLARPIVAERLLAKAAMPQVPVAMSARSVNYTLPGIPPAPSIACTDDTWTATSTTNAPAARKFHTAVWTGTEMIVWGGDGPGPIYFNTGGRYNPTTDSWTATSTTNAPDARTNHTAVWTGSEMIVWGGANGGRSFNAGGKYDPSTDSWIATSTTNPPSMRQFHTAVWTGSEMIVWGGLPGLLNTGGRCNSSTDSWTATSTVNAPDGREFYTAVWTGNEMIIWGGNGSGGYLNTGGRYDPETDGWTETST